MIHHLSHTQMQKHLPSAENEDVTVNISEECFELNVNISLLMFSRCNVHHLSVLALKHFFISLWYFSFQLLFNQDIYEMCFDLFVQ